jgi:hypothetical protein
VPRTRSHRPRNRPAARPREDVRALALPPETRTVGQLVAEAVRIYGSHFWPAIALGIAPAVVGVLVAAVPGRTQLALAMTLGAIVMSTCYSLAVSVATGAPLDSRTLSMGVAVGVLVATPVPFLAGLLVLPAVVWLALFGLAVPVAIVERTGVLDSLRRAAHLARTDYLHAVGALAALTVVGLVTTWAMFFLLRGQGEATLAIAAFLAVLVISPLLFIGGALLYVDQVARDERSQPA